MHALKRAWELWDRWFFAPADDRNGALLRMGFALLCLWQGLELWPDREMLLGHPGLIAPENRAAWRFSLFAWIDAPGPLLMVWAAAAIALLVGFCSRLSLLICWLFVVSVSLRGGGWTDGSDNVMRIFGLYLLFLDVGRTWSVDALRKPVTGFVSGWPLKLMTLNLILVYVKTGLIKAPNATWQSGTAVFYSLASPTFWRFDMAPILSMEWVHPISVVMTYATLVFEIGFPLILIRWFRHKWLLFGVFLHTGVILFMNLGLFTPAILWTYLAVVELPKRR